MKIAVSGKGGVGKSTIAAILAQLLAKKENRVVALDADPDANLASALGFSAEEQKLIIPISKQAALIEERTGAKVNQYGQIFKLNPEVSDIAEKYSFTKDNISLLVLGAVKKGGGGCACPENVLIRSLVTDLVLYKNDVLIMDMEAGIEHLGRATTASVDCMLVVVEPGQRSIDCAYRIKEMAEQIGLNKVKYIANKIIDNEDKIFIKNQLPEADILGIVPYSKEIKKADRDSTLLIDSINEEIMSIFLRIIDKI